jgi:hypothetical protein
MAGDPVHTLHSITGIKIVKNQYSDVDLERGIKKPELVENSTK